MSKIVILEGSLRKNGNSTMLSNAFIKGAKTHNEVEVINVADYKVNPCTGCNYCYSSENNACAQKDDMNKIYDILKDADVIFIASPVYFYGISARLKAIIDRLHTPYRNNFKVQKLGLLLVAADTLNEVFDSILVQYKLILNYFKLQDAGKVLVYGVKDIGDIKDNKALDEAFNLGESLRD